MYLYHACSGLSVDSVLHFSEWRMKPNYFPVIVISLDLTGIRSLVGLNMGCHALSIKSRRTTAVAGCGLLTVQAAGKFSSFLVF